MDQADAFPAKAFFVKMLTRDIDLEDAILDLIDNCVDGILRSKWNTGIPAEINNPYKGFSVNIEMDANRFIISDNCGGIPKIVAREYAFKMGKKNYQDEDIPTVGVYGIGMKRAIFKMGQNSEVISKTDVDSFKVTIDSNWIETDGDWLLPIVDINRDDIAEVGTTIKVESLYPSISSWFSNEANIDRLRNMISNHYSIIILKGLQITVNDVIINPTHIGLLVDEDFDHSSLAPYIYTANYDGVDVFLIIGFYRERPDREEVQEDLKVRRSKENAGWTVVCNDRVVIYKDKTILTGWGEGNVPQYHSQFISISGIVYFKSNHVEKLPLKTTKRGIEASSPTYLMVKNYMRTGLKLFTDYTNRWKGNLTGERQATQNAKIKDINYIKGAIPTNKWNPVPNTRYEEKVYRPQLPKPKDENTRRSIQFMKPDDEIKLVSDFLFGNKNASASLVGETCFNRVLSEI